MNDKWYDYLWYLFCGLLAIGVIFGLRWLIGPAKSQEWPPRHKCEWTGTCKKLYYDRRRAPSYYAAPQWRGARCLDPIDAIGAEAYATDKAKANADAAWMEKVRFLHGVRFMDLANATGLRYECSKSSTGQRASEKLAGAVTGGGSLEQCQVIALPCRAEREKEPQ